MTATLPDIVWRCTECGAEEPAPVLTDLTETTCAYCGGVCEITTEGNDDDDDDDV